MFALDPAGNETYLYQFSGGDDGDGPLGGLYRDPSGALYGTTVSGGTANQHRCNDNNNGACGVVFKFNGALTTLHVFNGGQYGDGDGFQPYWGAIADRRGNVYGTTDSGGSGQGGATLTEDGRFVLASYRQMQTATRTAIAPQVAAVARRLGDISGRK